MAVCPHCRAEIPPLSRVCPQCGASVPAPDPARPLVILRVVRADGGPEITFTLHKDEAAAGSAAEIPLLDDPFVARRQARFFFNGSVPMVEDAGGGNGVFGRIKSEMRLRPGQELRCGRQRLLIEPLFSPPPNSPRVWGSPDPGYRFRVIQMLEGGRRGDAFLLKDGESTIGRENGEITFPGDGFVSGRHALMTVRGEALTVRDTGSSNGTFLRLEGPMRLEKGDQLLIGRHLVKVDVQSA
jgi:hypothetical protein